MRLRRGSYPWKTLVEAAQGVDVAIHECMMRVEEFFEKMKVEEQ